MPIRMSSLPVNFLAALTVSIVCSVSSRNRASSFTVPTSGIMISGLASIFFFTELIAASVIAVTCMTRISG